MLNPKAVLKKNKRFNEETNQGVTEPDFHFEELEVQKPSITFQPLKPEIFLKLKKYFRNLHFLCHQSRFSLAQPSARAATAATCSGSHYPVCKSLSALTVATHSLKLLSVWQRNQGSLKGLSVFVFSQMKSGSDECSVWPPTYLESSNQVAVARVFCADGSDRFYTFAQLKSSA